MFVEGYNPEIGARLLLLPHQGNVTAMIILLPDQDLNLMIESMNEDTIEFITDQRNYKLRKMQIYIPKMKYKNELNVQKVRVFKYLVTKIYSGLYTQT